MVNITKKEQELLEEKRKKLCKLMDDFGISLMEYNDITEKMWKHNLEYKIYFRNATIFFMILSFFQWVFIAYLIINN